jgi:hypothetical protein
METIMWVSTARQRELPTVTILGRPVAVHLRLAHVSWDFGDGHSATTDTPGTLDGPPSTATLLVQQARSVLVPDPTPT